MFKTSDYCTAKKVFISIYKRCEKNSVNTTVKNLLGPDYIFVIAEIGKNFIQTEKERPVSEYLRNAKALVNAAKDAGCDAVKFQTHEVQDEVLNVNFTSPHFEARDRHSWVARNTKATPLEKFWKPLKRHCDKKGITFFSTPMSRKAAQKLQKVGVPFWKIGSGDIFDYVLLDYIAGTKKPVIYSTGMTSLNELDSVVSYFSEKEIPQVVLYCISKYPAPKKYFNLATIEYLKEKYPDITIGFSDHSLGYDVALAAVKVGARVIEKHFSFSRMLWGADHKVSMTPSEMKEMVMKIRSGAYKKANPAPYYGRKDRELEGAKNQFRPYFHKALVAGNDIPAGKVITKNMIFAMRPKMHSRGLAPERLHECAGRRAKKALKKYEPITKNVLT